MDKDLKLGMVAYQSMYSQPEEVEQLDEGMDMKDFKERRRKLQRKAASDDAKERGHVDKFTGKPYGTEEAASRRKNIHTPAGKPNRDAARDAAGGETGHGGPLKAKKVRKAKAMGELGEGVDLFDYLLEYLVAEGYADTNKAALAIMANMSEEWKQSIVEGGINTTGPAKKDPKTGDMVSPTNKPGTTVRVKQNAPYVDGRGPDSLF